MSSIRSVGHSLCPTPHSARRHGRSSSARATSCSSPSTPSRTTPKPSAATRAAWSSRTARPPATRTRSPAATPASSGRRRRALPAVRSPPRRSSTRSTPRSTLAPGAYRVVIQREYVPAPLNSPRLAPGDRLMAGDDDARRRGARPRIRRRMEGDGHLDRARRPAASRAGHRLAVPRGRAAVSEGRVGRFAGCRARRGRLRREDPILDPRPGRRRATSDEARTSRGTPSPSRSTSTCGGPADSRSASRTTSRTPRVAASPRPPGIRCGNGIRAFGFEGTSTILPLLRQVAAAARRRAGVARRGQARRGRARSDSAPRSSANCGPSDADDRRSTWPSRCWPRRRGPLPTPWWTRRSPRAKPCRRCNPGSSTSGRPSSRPSARSSASGSGATARVAA